MRPRESERFEKGIVWTVEQSSRDGWPRAWKHLEPLFGDCDPNTITPEIKLCRRCAPTLRRGVGERGASHDQSLNVHTCQGLRPRRVFRALALNAPLRFAFHIHTETASAPEMRSLARLDGWPMRSPVNASPVPSRVPAHDSRSMWFATPSSWWTFTSYFLPA